MKISCQSCAAKYTIADDKVRGKSVRIKCKKCGSTIVVGADSPEAGAPAPAAPAAAPSGGDWMLNVGEGDQRSVTAEQIGEMYRSGSINDETYVWRDGMADWLPLGSVSELSSVLASRVSAPAPAAVDEMEDDLPTRMASIPEGLFGGGGGGGAPAPAPRPAAGRGADLFAAKPPPDEDDGDMATRVAASPMAVDFAAKASVPAAGAPAPAARRLPKPEPAPAPAPAPPQPFAEPPMAGSANNEASGLLDIRKLQASLKQPEKKSEKVDDIMSLGGGGPLFAAPSGSPFLAPPDLSAPPPPEPAAPVAAAPTPPVSMPTVPEKKSSTGLIVGVLVGVLGLLGGGGALAMSMMNKGDAAKTPAAVDSKADAKDEKKADAKDEKKADAKDEKKADAKDEKKADAKDEKKADAKDDKGEKKDDKKEEAEALEITQAKEMAALTPEEKKRREEAFKKKKEEAEAKKKEEEDKKKKEEEAKKKEAEAPAAAAAGGGGDKPFDRAAALSALGSAAGAAASCKKSDGPTGSGRIAVTFAPSGNVTTANIEGPPFAGTSVGSCIAAKFRSAKVPAFSGSAVTVKKSFSIN